MRAAASLVLCAGDEEELRRLLAARSVPAGLARRARICLLDAGGLASVPTVRHWRDRYASGGLAALADALRSGCPRHVDENELVVRTLPPSAWQGQSKPRKVAFASSAVANSFQSMFARFRLFSTLHRQGGMQRNGGSWPRRSTTRIG